MPQAPAGVVAPPICVQTIGLAVMLAVRNTPDVVTTTYSVGPKLSSTSTGRKPGRVPGGYVLISAPPAMPGLRSNSRVAGPPPPKQHIVYSTRDGSARSSKPSQQSRFVQLGLAAPASVVAKLPLS